VEGANYKSDPAGDISAVIKLTNQYALFDKW